MALQTKKTISIVFLLILFLLMVVGGLHFSFSSQFQKKRERLFVVSYPLLKKVLPKKISRQWASRFSTEKTEQRNWYFAKSIMEQMLGDTPNDATLLNNLGIIALEEKDFSKAVEFLKKSQEADKSCVECKNNYGVALYYSYKKDEAKTLFEEAAKLSTSYFDPRINLAVSSEDSGQYVASRDWYKQAESLTSDASMKTMIANRVVMINSLSELKQRDITSSEIKKVMDKKTNKQQKKSNRKK